MELIMTPSLRHGLYLGGFLIAYGVFFRFADIGHNSPLGWVFYLSLPVAAFLSLKARANKETQSFTQALSRGGVTILVGALLYAIYVYGFNAFIDDSLIQTVREQAFSKIDSADQNAQSRISLIRTLTTPHGFATTIFFQLLIAGIATLFIIAPFARNQEK